jgi:microcystin-dependent protein
MHGNALLMTGIPIGPDAPDHNIYKYWYDTFGGKKATLKIYDNDSSEWIEVNLGGSATPIENEPIEGVPGGAIIMWSGSIATIPSGWALCNGANGTPDLRNRFVIGSSSDVSGVSNTSVTGANTKSGGSKDAIVVAHTHSGTANSGTGGGNFVSDLYYGAQPNHFFRTGTGGAGSGYIHKSVASAGAHTHSLTINSTGSSGTNANLPPYYALAFIMKL